MRTFIQRHTSMVGLLAGVSGALLLLTLTTRTGMAEKSDPDPDKCSRGMHSICRLVETCEPKGFEPNGTCKWIYTARRYYWN